MLLRTALAATALLLATMTAAAPVQQAALPFHGLGPDAPAPQIGPMQECGVFQRQIVQLTPKATVGEPVYFRLLVTNKRVREDHEFRTTLSFGNDIKAFIMPPGGRVYEYAGLRMGSAVPNSVVKMGGVRHFRFDMRLAMDDQTVTGAAFDIPGTYKIRFTMACRAEGENRGDTQLMGDFALEVTQPQGDDALALEILNNFEIFRTFQARTTQLGTQPLTTAADIRKLERVVKEAPAAAIRPHAMVILAQHYRREGDVDASLAMLDRVLADHPESLVAEEALLAKLNIAEAAGRRDLARQAYLQAWQDPKTGQVLIPGSWHYEAFVTPTKPPANPQWMVMAEPWQKPEMLEREGMPRIVVSPEVQAEWGLPEVIFPGIEQ